MDFATSADPAVQRQLDRLAALSVPQGRLGLGTIRALLERLGNPHLRLPPVFHVAGTNGKGSTCAFLRATLEADGKRVHATTSPHLVRYNERIRVAGRLIEDARLAELLAEVLDAGEELAPSFFEVTIAAAFVEFAGVPADACVIEVGLGGRFDATNVIEDPAICGIAALGIDHERFLLAPEEGVPSEPLARIAFEKAGIVKPGRPVVALSYPEGAFLEVERAAMAAGAPLAVKGRDWDGSAELAGLHYRDRHGELALPAPTLPGPHQIENAALAIAMLRHQDVVSVSREAMAEASGTDLAGFEAQLASTEMFVDPAEAVAFAADPALAETMTGVAKFLFDKGILGTGAPSADFVGIAYPGGAVTGDEANVKLRFDTEYMQMAADGAL